MVTYVGNNDDGGGAVDVGVVTAVVAKSGDDSGCDPTGIGFCCWLRGGGKSCGGQGSGGDGNVCLLAVMLSRCFLEL